MRNVWALWLGVAAVAAHAQTAPADEADQRAGIASQRVAAQARYDEAMRTCEGVFAVTACLDRAKSERRREIDRLAREQARLDEGLRRRRAAERKQGINEKPEPAASRSAASAPPPRVRGTAQAASSASAPSRRVRSGDEHAQRAADEAAARQAAAARRRAQAEAHAQAVQRRNAERDAKRAPAAPLPSASAPTIR